MIFLFKISTFLQKTHEKVKSCSKFLWQLLTFSVRFNPHRQSVVSSSACVRVRACECVCVCLYECVPECVYACGCAHECVWLCVHACVCDCVRVRACKCVWVCVWKLMLAHLLWVWWLVPSITDPLTLPVKSLEWNTWTSGHDKNKLRSN